MSTDPVTASTPPLVEVIAGVLADTPYESLEDCARAVLAALEQAGSVELGVRTTYCDVVTVDTKADAQAIAKDSGYPVVSRVAAGPWERAE